MKKRNLNIERYLREHQDAYDYVGGITNRFLLEKLLIRHLYHKIKFRAEDGSTVTGYTQLFYSNLREYLYSCFKDEKYSEVVRFTPFIVTRVVAPNGAVTNFSMKQILDRTACVLHSEYKTRDMFNLYETTDKKYVVIFNRTTLEQFVEERRK